MSPSSRMRGDALWVDSLPFGDATTVFRGLPEVAGVHTERAAELSRT